MKLFMKRLFLLIVCIVFLGIADSVSAVVIAPTVFDQIKIEPGLTQVEQILIYNDSPTEKVFSLSPINFVSENEDGVPKFTDSENGLASWISPIENSIVLEPDEEAEFNFEISVPESVEPGGYYAAVFVTEQNIGQEEGVGVTSNVGSLLLVEVVGEIMEAASLVEFEVMNSFTNRLPIEFYTRIENSGTVHFKPSGFIKIKNIFDVEVASIPVNPVEGNVLPNTTRRLETFWIKDLDINENGFFTELKNEFKNFGLGKYRAELELTWSDTQGPLIGEVVFWVIPWRLFSVSVVGVALLLLLSKSRRLFG